MDLFELRWIINKLSHEEKNLDSKRSFESIVTVFRGHTIFSLFNDNEAELAVILNHI